MSNGRRPFDVLDSSKDGNVLVKLKGYSGNDVTSGSKTQE
jgi:small nuclear ribonucleoprotein (snRNP)-like protein